MYNYNGKDKQDSINKLKKYMDKDNNIIIYRGINEHTNPHGYSWTLDIKKAEWFARRFFSDAPSVISAKCYIGDVIAYITDRDEEEIVIHPDDVKILDGQDYLSRASV
ncbi:hypothetical protein D3C74_137790 [compost metagenome]